MARIYINFRILPNQFASGYVNTRAIFYFLLMKLTVVNPPPPPPTPIIKVTDGGSRRTF